MAGALKILKTLLSSAGVGQDEAKYLFDETAKKFLSREITTLEECRGAKKVLEDMLQVMMDERVISSETRDAVRARLKELIAGIPDGPQKS
jgi:hypothetical protein